MADRSIAFSDLEQSERRALLMEDLGTFVQVMFEELNPGSTLVWAPYLGLLCSRLQDVAHGSRRNLIITMPPRNLKSFCVSVALPAYVLGHYPNQDVMCVSYGQDLANEFAGGSRQIMLSRPYVDLFGRVLLNPRSRAQAMRTTRGGVRRATSIDGVATGVGADLMLFDDPQKPNETLSDAIRRSTNEAYEQTFLSRRNMPTNSRIVIVMQRLHEDDFVGHVLEIGGDWEVINLPAIAEEDQAIAYSTAMGDKTYYRQAGEALHPGRVPLDELAKIRAASGEAVWASQYQQRPAPAGGGLVKIEWFKRYTDAELPTAFDRVVQSWDTANTTEEWSAYSVCTTWGVKDKHVYLLHVWRDKVDYPGLRKAVIQQAQMHEANEVLIEDRASGTQILQELKNASFGRARAVKPVGDKQIRMVNQTALIENGFVHLPVEAPWLADFLNELVMFPKCKYFDQIDSMSQALDGINSWTGGRGLLEFYRQQAEELRAREEAIWVLKAPPQIGSVYDIEGGEHLRGEDGLFHLKQSVAKNLINQVGWSLISRPD